MPFWYWLGLAQSKIGPAIMISFYLNRGQAKISTNEWWNCVIAPVGPALCALKCGLRLKLVFLMHENFLALRRAQLNKSREFNLERVNRINPWCFDLFVSKPRYQSKCSFAFTKLRNKRALVLLFCVPWIFCPSLSWVLGQCNEGSVSLDDGSGRQKTIISFLFDSAHLGQIKYVFLFLLNSTEP